MECNLYLFIFLLGCPHGVMFKALNYRIVVSESEYQSRYYIGKGIIPLILPSMG